METLFWLLVGDGVNYYLIASIIGSGINGNICKHKSQYDVRESLLLLEVELMETFFYSIFAIVEFAKSLLLLEVELMETDIIEYCYERVSDRQSLLLLEVELMETSR